MNNHEVVREYVDKYDLRHWDHISGCNILTDFRIKSGYIDLLGLGTFNPTKLFLRFELDRTGPRFIFDWPGTISIYRSTRSICKKVFRGEEEDIIRMFMEEVISSNKYFGLKYDLR